MYEKYVYQSSDNCNIIKFFEIPKLSEKVSRDKKECYQFENNEIFDNVKMNKWQWFTISKIIYKIKYI